MYKKIHAFLNNKSVALSAADSMMMQKKPIHVTSYFSCMQIDYTHVVLKFVPIE